jgi:transcription antitermination factor NusG
MKVPNREMEEFMEVARHYDADLTYYRPEEIELDKGTRIRIIGGTFDGAQGILVRIKGKRGKRLVVQIPELMAIATTYIEPEFIQILSNN